MFSIFGSRGGWKPCFPRRQDEIHQLTLEEIFFNVKKNIPPNLILQHYEETVEFIVTLDERLQIPHWDTEPSKDRYGWIVHFPLTKEGSHINIWDESGQDCETFFIPFGGFLVLRDDVAHGGVFGDRGNLRAHLMMLPKKDVGQLLLADDQQAWYKHAKEKGYGVNIDEAKNIFDDKKMSELRDVQQALFHNFAIKQNYLDLLSEGRLV